MSAHNTRGIAEDEQRPIADTVRCRICGLAYPPHPLETLDRCDQSEFWIQNPVRIVDERTYVGRPSPPTHTACVAVEAGGWVTMCGIYVDTSERLSDEPSCLKCRQEAVQPEWERRLTSGEIDCVEPRLISGEIAGRPYPSEDLGDGHVGQIGGLSDGAK